VVSDGRRMHDQMQRQLESGAYKNVTLQQDPNRPNVFVGASTGTVDPAGRLTLVDRHTTYAHNDPNAASPRNDFVARLVPFLARVARGRPVR
jgi:hypothetical protein